MNAFPPNHNPLFTPHPLLPEFHQSEAQRPTNLNEQFDQVAADYNWISQVLSFVSGNWHIGHAPFGKLVWDLEERSWTWPVDQAHPLNLRTEIGRENRDCNRIGPQPGDASTGKRV